MGQGLHAVGLIMFIMAYLVDRYLMFHNRGRVLSPDNKALDYRTNQEPFNYRQEFYKRAEVRTISCSSLVSFACGRRSLLLLGCLAVLPLAADASSAGCGFRSARARTTGGPGTSDRRRRRARERRSGNSRYYRSRSGSTTAPTSGEEGLVFKRAFVFESLSIQSAPQTCMLNRAQHQSSSLKT